MYSRVRNKSIIYAFLVVRTHYMTSAADDLAFSSLLLSRAAFCELMAIKLLREFSGFDLVIVCTTQWNALQGAPDVLARSIRKEVADDDLEETISAVEVRPGLISPADRKLIDVLPRKACCDERGEAFLGFAAGTRSHE